MSRKVRNLPASVLDRLRNVARERKLPFDWILQYYANERFLYRISQSEHCDKFVLKGGLIFISWDIPLRRHTRDIDLLAFTSSDLKNIAQIIKDVCIQPVEPDAITFAHDSIETEVITEQAEYPGVRVRLWARIGDTTRVRIQIDMGFSDEITPAANRFTYPTILKMPAPQMYGYPKETVVAEKFHTLIHHGSATSRRKDFYDLWFISQQFDFDGSLLQQAIISTFGHRGTSIPKDIPLVLSNNYAMENEQNWKAFLNTFSPEDLELKDFSKVITELRNFLLPPTHSIINQEQFDLHWTAGKFWS